MFTDNLKCTLHSHLLQLLHVGDVVKPYIRIVPGGYIVIGVMTSWQVAVCKDPHLPAAVDDNLTTCYTKTPTYCS